MQLLQWLAFIIYEAGTEIARLPAFMEKQSSLVTAAAGLTGTQMAGVIVWLCTLANITPPSIEVAGTIGVGILALAHMAFNSLLKPGQTVSAPVDVPPVKVVPNVQVEPAP